MGAEILIGEGLYIKTVMFVSTEFSKVCPVGSGLGFLPSPHCQSESQLSNLGA